MYQKKTKVMLILTRLNAGGIQKFVIDLAHHLDKDKFDVSILCLKHRSGELFEKKADEYGIPVFYLHKKDGMDLAIISQIYRAIKEFRPDIIHANQRTLTYAILPILLLKIKTVLYTVHNLAEYDASGIHRHIIQLAHTLHGVTLVAISDICKKSISEVYGIPIDDIPCIYNGVDVDYFTPPSNPVKKDIDFLSVGRMSSQKNYPLMLSAYKHVCEKYPSAKLVILGDGDKRHEIEEFCLYNNLKGNVEMPGNVSNVCEYMWRAKVFLMSSDYEGLPITVLEAMATSLPIISTKAGGVPDIVKDRINGRLIDTGDVNSLTAAMIDSIQNKETFDEYSQNSRSMSLQYSIEACAEKYMRLYTSLYEQKG